MPDFQHNSIRIHWESSGRGEPVAFLNGVLMSTQSWKLQTLAIDAQYHCLLHDFRGQLLSSKPSVAWTMEDHAQDFLELLDNLGIGSCHIVGTSYGGEVGMLFAAKWPERVRSLSVISSVSEVGADVDSIVCEWRQAAIEAPETLYRTMLPTTFSPQFLAANPMLIELGEERLRNCDAAFFQAFARLIDAFRQINITPCLNDIRCPVLVMVGEQDQLKPPRYSRLIAERIKDAELVVVPRAAHAVVLEQPESVNAELLGFLRRIQAELK